MGEEYQRVVKRLKSYRQELKFRQAEMGEKLGINQAHYSKIESGTVTLSCSGLQSMLEHSLDVDYIFTGKKSETSELDLLIRQCPGPERADLMGLIIWTVQLGYQTLGREALRDYERDVEILRLYSCSDKSIWYILRQVNEITQVKMAECVGMNIKRYRKLEKGEIQADGEVLALLYKNTFYLPSLIVSNKGYSMGRINEIWNRFDDSLAETLYNHITAGAKMVDKVYQEMAELSAGRGV